ncbi:hypothetical protein FRC12_021908 [Ceratobasidium sp. 428]|nr:hypothetical protein FRC12_021908 [Ceratobasidium sp. 428]
MAQQQKAFFLLAKQGKTEVSTRPIPTPKGNQALVKITAAAINPVDPKICDLGIPFVTQFPAVLGIDAAGVIESVGPDVTAFKKGDRVLFEGEFQPSDLATFQQYALGDTDAMAKIPDNITDDQASTIPLGSSTALFGLFQKSRIAFPENGPTATGKSIFIFGGSSSVGEFAIQFARIAGFSTIATTASEKHTERLKSLGATHVFSQETGLENVRAAVPPAFNSVFNIFPSPATQALGIDLLATPSLAPGAHYGGVRPLDPELKAKVEGKITTHSVFGSSQTDKSLSIPYWKVLSSWLEDGSFVPNRVQVVKGGLNGVADAFDQCRKGVSGVKLVVHPQE